MNASPKHKLTEGMKETASDGLKSQSAGACPIVPGQIPLVFGITGHRDLRPMDIPQLEAKIAEIFQDFQRRYPSTPLVLLSPLAEGADRLAARVALNCGMRLIVPLPMMRALYEMDFDAPESRAEFDHLLSQADDWLEMPLIAGNTNENLPARADGRGWQYAQVGAYIVRNCQILIALWDGLPSDRIGGTAEVVHFQATGIPEHYYEKLATPDGAKQTHLDPAESGPVFHIVTPRISNTQVPGEALTLRKQYRRHEDDDEIEEESGRRRGHRKNQASVAVYERIYENLNVFNENAIMVDRTPSLSGIRENSKKYLLPEDEAKTISPALLEIRECHAVADTLAQHFQRRTLETLILLSIIVCVPALLFESYEVTHNSWFLLFYPLVLVIVYLGWTYGLKRSKWQDKFQDYRAVAEGLRVEFFWTLVGLPVSVADHYLRKQKSELEWVRIAIKNSACVEHGLPFESGSIMVKRSDSIYPERWDLVLKHWVRDQARYFANRAIPRDEKQLEKSEKLVSVLLIGSQLLPAVLALALLPLPYPESVHHALEPVREWLEHNYHEHIIVALTPILALVAGLIHAYVEKKALSQHVKQYKRMNRIFTHAEHRLEGFLKLKEYRKATELVLELGKESLAENGDWIMTHRERPLDVPQAG